MPTRTQQQPQGCLTVLLKLIGIDLGKGQQKHPYRLRDDFLSAAELSFFRVLQQSVKEDLVICPKVRLADLFMVPQAEGSQAWRNKIDRKHVDFLLCEPATMRPRLGIELDDSSHAKQKRQERDQLVEAVFEAAQLPLLRVPATRTYSVLEITEQIHLNLAQGENSPLVEPQFHQGVPICPKCGIKMVERTASKGTRRGTRFWGCQNYPQCRETIPV